MAHEIDNPMAIIKGNAEYLRRHFFREVSLSQEQQKEAEEVLTAILEAQTRVSGMVKAIEEFGKKTLPRWLSLSSVMCWSIILISTLRY